MEKQSNDEIEFEIDIFRALKAVVRKWPLIFFAACFAAVAAYAFFSERIYPSYTCSGKIYVIDKEAQEIRLSIEDLDVGSKLVADYKELILSRIVLEKVISQLELDISYEGLKQCLTVYNQDDTRIIEITVNYGDRVYAQQILNKVEDLTCNYLPEKLGTEHPTILERACEPTLYYDKSPLLMTIVCAAGVGFVGAVFFALMDILNSKIRYRNEVEQKLQLELLGNVPRIAKRKKTE